MSSDDQEEPRVPIVCPACETRTRVPIEEVADTVQRHNDRLHDGADVAEVDPAVADHIADLVATDLGLLEDPE
ncbi:MAG: hypothetical protein V5A46_09260 [Haloferacaceae archaeon]